MYWSLSPVFVKKEEERHGLSRKKYGHMKVQVLRKKQIERKKCGHMKDHEKKEIAMLSKGFI